MIGYTYTITNSAGDFFKINDFVTDPNNYFLLQQYPDMDVDVKNTEIDLQGQHGIWDFYSYFGKRNLTFSGMIIGVNEAGVEASRTQMMKVLQLPVQPTSTSDGYVTISWTDATGATWSFRAKISRTPKLSRNLRQQYKLDFLISLKTDTPFILSSASTTGSGTRGYFSYGFLLPVILPAVMGYVENNAIVVANAGTLSAHTIIRLYGENTAGVINPKITNMTTGKSFKINTTLTDASKYVEINSSTGTVVDQDGNDLSGSIDSISEFILLNAGNNTIVYTGDNGVGTPAGNFSVIFYSTKI